MDSFSPRMAAETCSSISPLSSVPALVLSTRVKRSNIRLSVIAARSLRTTLRSVDRDWSLASSRPPRQQHAGLRCVTGAGAGISGTGNGRFRVQVDRQTKASYATWEAAEKSGTGDQEGASDFSCRG